MKVKAHVVFLSQILRRLRDRQGLSQRQLAEDVRRSERYLQELEASTKAPSLLTLRHLFKRFDEQAWTHFIQAMAQPEVAKALIPTAPENPPSPQS